MTVEVEIGGRPDARDHRNAERDVGNEVAVHHVEMEPIGVRNRHLAIESGKVCGEQ